MEKRPNISARRGWGDEEIAKEPEKEGREGKGGEERGEVSWKPVEKGGRRH